MTDIGRALPQLTGDDAPCSNLCYCERGGNRAEIKRLRSALNEVIRIKDDTLGPRDGIETIVGREHFDRGCRMAFYRCAKIARDALEQSGNTE